MLILWSAALNCNLKKSFAQQFYFRKFSQPHFISVKAKFSGLALCFLLTPQPRLHSLWLSNWMRLRKSFGLKPWHRPGIFIHQVVYYFYTSWCCQPCHPSNQCQGQHGQPGPGLRQRVTECQHIST